MLVRRRIDRGPAQQSGADQTRGEPDYSQVNDFLNGQKHIIRNDDLIINFAASLICADDTRIYNYAE